MKLLQNLSLKFCITQLLFWVFTWLFFVYFLSFNSDDSSYVIWFANWLTPVTIGITYFVVYHLIPRYLLVKKYYQFGLYGFYTLISNFACEKDYGGGLVENVFIGILMLLGEVNLARFADKLLFYDGVAIFFK